MLFWDAFKNISTLIKICVKEELTSEQEIFFHISFSYWIKAKHANVQSLILTLKQPRQWGLLLRSLLFCLFGTVPPPLFIYLLKDWENAISTCALKNKRTHRFPFKVLKCKNNMSNVCIKKRVLSDAAVLLKKKRKEKKKRPRCVLQSADLKSLDWNTRSFTMHLGHCTWTS